jgi:hypothetical protein
MATNARDKLQASAREWMRNLEEVMSKKNTNTEEASLKDGNPLENVMRTMFGACTVGADVAGSPVSVQLQDSSSSNSHSSSPRSVANESHHGADEVPSKQDIGEHIYAQLFFDDQARASKAVNSVRDQDTSAKPTERTPLKTNVPKPFHVSSPSGHISPARPVATAPLSSEELNIPANCTFDDTLSAISAHTLEAMALKVCTSRSRSDLDSSVFQDVHEKRETLGANRSPFDTPAQFGRPRSSQTWGSKNSVPTVGTRSSQSTRTTESSSFEHMWHLEEQKYWEDECTDDPLRPEKNGCMKESRLDSRSKNRGRSSRNSNKVCCYRVAFKLLGCAVLNSESTRLHTVLHIYLILFQSRKNKQGSTLSTVSSSAHSEWSSQFEKHHPHEEFHFESSDLFATGRAGANPAVHGNVDVFQSASRSDPDFINQILPMPEDTEMAEI